MSLSQIVRTQKTASNPTGIVSDLLQIGQTLSSSGAPNSSTPGITGNTYIDSSTGITYIKQSDGSWQPIYDPGTVPVNDPLIAGTLESNFVKTDEIEVDALKGRLAESMVIDLQTAGDLQIVSGSGEVKLGCPLDMQGNAILNASVMIPDPLPLNQLNVNNIQGFADDNVALNLGAGGSLNVTCGGTEGINFNGTNARIQGNGFAEFQSSVRTFDVISDNFAGRQMTVSPSDYSIRVTGLADDISLDAGANDVKMASDLNLDGKSLVNKSAGQPLAILNQAAGQPVIITANGGEVQTTGDLNVNAFDIKNAGPISGATTSLTSNVGNLDLNAPAGSVNISSTAGDINCSPGTLNVIGGITNLESTGGSLQLKHTAIASITNTSDSSGFVFDSTNGVQAVSTPGLMRFEHAVTNQNLELRCEQTGSGSVILNPGASGQIDASSKDIVNVSGINNSASIIQNSVLNVSNTGVLSYRAYPQSIEMIQSGFGNNGTDYFNLGTSTIGPGEVWGICSGNGRSLAEFSVRLHSNAAFNFGGGSAQLQVGYIANNVPMTEANFTVLRSVNLDTVSDLYGVSLTGYNDAIPFRAAVCARTVLAGTSSTISNAELSLNIILI